MNNNLISVSSKLMQNYHVGNPVSAGTRIATFTNNIGEVEVLSIGSDFNLYNFYPDSNSSTGWGMMKVQLPDNMKVKEVVAGAMSTVISVALVKTDTVIKKKGMLPVPLLTLTRLGAPGTAFSVNYIKEGGEYNNNKLEQIPVQPESITLQSRQLSGDVQLVYSGLTTNGTGWLINQEVYPPMLPKQPALADHFGRCSSKINSLAILNYDNPGNGNKYLGMVSALVNDEIDGQKGTVTFLQRQWSSNRMFLSGKENICSQVATTELPNAVFAIRSADKALLYLESHEKTYENKYTNMVLTTPDQKMSSVVGTTDKAGNPVAIAIGEDGFLYHAEIKRGVDIEKLALIENHLNFAHCSVSKNDEGMPIIFAMTKTDNTATSDKLFMIWQNPDGLWQKEEIKVEIKDREQRKADQYDTYSTEITVFDKVGVVRPNALVKIWCGGSENLIINGKGFIVDAYRSANVKTNDAGKVTIVSETRDIATSLMYVQTEFMEGTKGVAVQANGYIQEEFHTITPDQLLAAQGSEGQLLKSEYREPEAAKSLAEALNSSMQILQTSAEADSKLEHPDYSHVISGAKVHHVRSESFGQAHRINPNAEYTNSWKLSFESGLPVYTSLSSGEAAALFDQNNLATLDMKYYGFFDSLGDLWRMIKEGVCELVEFVVDGLKTAVTVLIDGVKKVWNGVVDFVQEIFQAVAGFFEKVKVFFADILHWLGTIFNWNNILRTKEVINYSFNTVLDFISDSAIQFAKHKFDDEIGKFAADFKAKIEKYKRDIGVDNFINYEEQSGSVNQSEPLGTVENNVMTNALVNNHNGADNIDLPINKVIDDSFKKLEPIADEFGKSKAWNSSKAKFEQMKGNPDNILQLAMESLLDLVEAIVEWGLEKVKIIIDTIFDAVSAMVKEIQKLLNDSFYIPVVTEIYNFAHHKTDTKGLPFTYLDVLSMIVAVPTTVLCTVVSGKAPFPDKASVDSFKQLFTVEWLNQKTGITKTEAPLATLSAPPDMQAINYAFNIMSSVVYTISIITKPIGDGLAIFEQTNPELKPGVKFFSGLEASLNTIGWISSTPWLVEPVEEWETVGFIAQVGIWELELIDDVILDWYFFSTDAEGAKESMFTSIFSSINLGAYITLALVDSKRAFNVSKTFPGVFAIVRPIAGILPEPAPLVGTVIMTIVDAVSNGVMAGFSIAAAVEANKGKVLPASKPVSA